MKVLYDDKQCAYIVKLEDCENVIFVNTEDIVEARNIFLKQMTSLFNNAVCEQLKD